MEELELFKYIKDQIMANGSMVKDAVKVEMLQAICRNREIKYITKDTKKILLDKLMQDGVELLELYVMWKHKCFGVHPAVFSKKFSVSKSQRKKMQDTGFLKVMYYVNQKVFTGTYADVPYYSLEQYFSLTQEDIEQWKRENIRGYKTKKDSTEEI